MEIHFSHASVWPLLSMVHPIAWFAVLILICVGTVPDMPILNSIVLSMSTPLLSSGDVMDGTLVFWTVVVDSARLLPAAFASLLFASLFAALRVPAMPYAVFVGFVCGIALVGPCPHLARFQSFVLVCLLVMMTMLVATRSVAGKRPTSGMLGCCCGAAIMLVTEAAFSYLFMKLRLQAAAAQAAALCVFGFHALHEASAASACQYVLSEFGQHAAAASAAALHLFGFHADLETSAATAYIFGEVGQRAAAASAAAFSCKNPVILLENEKSEFLWFCSGLLVFLQWCVAGKSGMLEFVDNFSQFGK